MSNVAKIKLKLIASNANMLKLTDELTDKLPPVPHVMSAIQATAILALSQSASRSLNSVMQLQAEDKQAMGWQQQRPLGAH